MCTTPASAACSAAGSTFLRRSLRELEHVLPRAQRVELEGLTHSGPWNTSRGGRPELVAGALENFFA